MWYVACFLVGSIAGFFFAIFLAAKKRLFVLDRELKGVDVDELGERA